MKRSTLRSRSSLRKKSKFESVANILTQALKKYGLDDRISRYQFVTHWPEIMGAAIAERSRPEYIRNSTLHVRVADAAWAQELGFQKPIIIKRLQRFLDKDTVVKDVRFFIGPL